MADPSATRPDRGRRADLARAARVDGCVRPEGLVHGTKPDQKLPCHGEPPARSPPPPARSRRSWRPMATYPPTWPRKAQIFVRSENDRIKLAGLIEAQEVDRKRATEEKQRKCRGRNHRTTRKRSKEGQKLLRWSPLMKFGKRLLSLAVPEWCPFAIPIQMKRTEVQAAQETDQGRPHLARAVPRGLCPGQRHHGVRGRRAAECGAHAGGPQVLPPARR